MLKRYFIRFMVISSVVLTLVGCNSNNQSYIDEVAEQKTNAKGQCVIIDDAQKEIALTTVAQWIESYMDSTKEYQQELFALVARDRIEEANEVVKKIDSMFDATMNHIDRMLVFYSYGAIEATEIGEKLGRENNYQWNI